MAATAPVGVPQSFPSPSLYVGDLAPDITEALLYEIFNAVGQVASVRVCRDAQTRRSLGYAYVNFHRLEDAERALDTMNFTSIRGKQCRIMWSHRDPSLRKSGAGNIFVKNLAPTIDNKTLYDTFSMFGNILSCKVATNNKGESLGYGFVHYESEEAAQNAIARVNGMSIAGQKVEVAPFRSKKERGGNEKALFTNVYVKNIPEAWDNDKLREFFAQFGSVTSVMVASGDEGKANKGFGFVNFERPEDAAAAVERGNDTEIDGKKIYVGRAQKKEERERELRDRFEQLKQERQKKYVGVNLYVKNLADNVDKDRLIEMFGKYGPISSARIMTDEANKSRGFGFVCFVNAEDATKAVTEMNGKMVDNKPLYVALAQRKEVRRAQLEAQYAARQKGMIPQPMYAQPHPGMFYPGAPARLMYPQAAGMIPRRWPPQQMPRGAPQMMGAMPLGYMGMQGNGRGPAMGGPRGGRGGRGGAAAAAAAAAAAGGRPKGMMPPGPMGAAAGRGGPRGAMGKYPAGMRMPAGMMGMAMQQPLTAAELAAAPAEQQKQMIGERLYPLVQQRDPEQASKITGMLLEMDNGELLHLLENDDALNEKVVEAQSVLRSAEEDANVGHAGGEMPVADEAQ
jgi:polyadenylate-binding protein